MVAGNLWHLMWQGRLCSGSPIKLGDSKSNPRTHKTLPNRGNKQKTLAKEAPVFFIPVEAKQKTTPHI